MLDLGNCKSYLLKNHMSDNNTRKKNHNMHILGLILILFFTEENTPLLSYKYVQTSARLSCL